MNTTRNKAKSIRFTEERLVSFEAAFEASNAETRDEFIQSLIDKANNDEPTVEIEEVEVEVEVEVEKKLEPNQILLSLTPNQIYAIKGHIAIELDFAELQNKIIDKLQGGKPLFAMGEKYNPAFHKLWIRSIVITDSMEEAEKEEAEKRNMGAYLFNSYLANLVSYNISGTQLMPDALEEFILNQKEDGNVA